ncbi:STAS domain-containing protein [Asinibacterium sp. OR53]|jgi:anti-anti-sigma factor|uniref:STAS domain-containing protein n=1 Tax=Asinibacterium sp. OR53 TaxID=925409 RepID=UPI00040EA1F0|nr:STAS domain-containing protein [Asinibacterium sp. OR53]
MEVKIDTKEKFTVVTPIPAELTANIAAEIREKSLEKLEGPVKNIVLNLRQVSSIHTSDASFLANLQQEFYEKNASFVICCLQEPIEAVFADADLLDTMNITPTESEAWDIVQMEEIERELLSDDDI